MKILDRKSYFYQTLMLIISLTIHAQPFNILLITRDYCESCALIAHVSFLQCRALILGWLRDSQI